MSERDELEIDSKYINGNSLYKETSKDYKASEFFIDDLIGESIDY